MPEKLLRFPEVRALSGLSRSTIYNRIAEGLFPPSLRLGARMVAWPETEIAAINAARIRGDGDEEIRRLVRNLEAARRRV